MREKFIIPCSDRERDVRKEVSEQVMNGDVRSVAKLPLARYYASMLVIQELDMMELNTSMKVHD